ncbi:MAG: ATP-binding cassette subfamily B protein, partial [Glaciecola sp.]
LSVELVGKMRLGRYLQSLLTDREPAKEVRGFGLGPELIKRFEHNQDDVRERNFKLTRRNEVSSQFANGVGWLVTAGGYGVLILLIVNDTLDLPGATVGAVAIQQARNLWGQALSAVSRAMTQAFPLDDLLWFLELPLPEPSPGRLEPFETLRLDDVTFRYPGSSKPAVENVSLEIKRGEVIALVGENGSGKTTLATLLNRLYVPSEGRIFWDDIDTATRDQAAVAQQVAMVFQDFQRYNFAARDNVALGRIERPTDTVGDSISAAGADFLHGLDEGLDTMLGRRFGGTDLSIGQWQRVAIARAFFRDAPLLILDEPTAALDPRAEHELFERIRDLFAGRTVVLISHRYSTVTSADRIVVMDKGRIVEVGPHRELLEQGGLYAELFNLQAAAYLAGSPPTEQVTGHSSKP